MSRVIYGRYVLRRLVRVGQDELADGVATSTALVLATARAVEDQEVPVQEAIADREAVDDELDDLAQFIRLQLASRSNTAARERPYKDIFEKGIEHYTSATLAVQVARYGELVDRMAEFLAAEDALQAEAAKVRTALAEWQAASAAVATARSALAIARTGRDAATDAWSVTMERTYGALVSLYGKRKADRFFPKSGRRREEDPESDASDASG